MGNARDTIVITGAAGGGKTDARLIMKDWLGQEGFGCNLFSDGEHLSDIVDKDQEGRWHIRVPEKEGKSTFQITHQHPYNEAVRRAAIVPETRKGQINLIEIARGIGGDYPGIDISYGGLFEKGLVPMEVWERAVVVYISCPRELRFAWNEGRRGNPMSQLGEKSFFVPTGVMEGRFAESDFMDKLFPRLEEIGVPVHLLDNSEEGIEIFRRKVLTITQRILEEHLGLEGQPALGKERRQ